MEDFKKALEGTLGRKHIDNIVDQVASSPDRFDALYTLTQHEETRIAWRATWACEKLSFLLPSLLMDKREELMLRAMQCPHDGTRRLLLNILHHLPVPKPVNAAFFDFCLQGMLSSAESASGQAVCMKTCLRHLPGRTGTDRRAESISGKYGTGILYGCSAMCPQQHPKKIR